MISISIITSNYNNNGEFVNICVYEILDKSTDTTYYTDSNTCTCSN